MLSSSLKISVSIAFNSFPYTLLQLSFDFYPVYDRLHGLIRTCISVSLAVIVLSTLPTAESRAKI